MNPTFGSLFAGVGGFDLGFENAGFDCKFQVEWDDNCQQTLAHHWPDVPRWGDVSEVNGADLPPVDVITYGFPCQDLSVAGKRAGLDGERSNLFFDAVRIIKEMREATNGLYPTFAVAENVAGLLNADKGDAMARVLDTLAEAGALVIEWCMLDAQWFGVPQRRRRVFVTACFDPATADRCPDQIFPVAESGSRNPAEVEQERQEAARTASDSVGECGLQRVTGTLAAGAHPGSYNGQDAYNDMLLPFVKAKRAQTDTDDETWEADRPKPTINQFDQGDSRATTAIVFTAQRVGREPRVYTETSPSLLARMGTGGNNTPMVAQTCAETSGALLARDYKDINTDGLDSKLVVQHDVVPTLRSGGDGGIPSSRGEHIVAFSQNEQLDLNQQIVGPLTTDSPKRVRGTETSDSGHIIAFDSTFGNQSVASFDVSPTVKVGSGLGIPSPPAVPQPHVVAPSLTASNNPSRSPQSTEVTQQIEAIHKAQPNLAVRRLTPLECERLMGWPDNHTLYRADGKDNSDSTRYRMCGNGVATPVATWLAKHLKPLL